MPTITQVGNEKKIDIFLNKNINFFQLHQTSESERKYYLFQSFSISPFDNNPCTKKKYLYIYILHTGSCRYISFFFSWQKNNVFEITNGTRVNDLTHTGKRIEAKKK